MLPFHLGDVPTGLEHPLMYANGTIKRSNVLPLSQLQQEHQLTEEFCQTNDNELKAQIARKMMDESRRQERPPHPRDLPALRGHLPTRTGGGNLQQRAEDLRTVHIEKQ